MHQQHRDRAGADLPSAPPPSSRGGCATESISSQAVRLHGLGMAASSARARDGLLDRAEAERLAERCGALTDELVEAGLWLELDDSFRVDGGSPQVRTPRTDDMPSEAPAPTGLCDYPLAIDSSNGRHR